MDLLAYEKDGFFKEFSPADDRMPVLKGISLR
jgi:hypothetical protein